MEKKSVILGFILAIALFGFIAFAAEAEDWNLGNPVTVQNQNVTGKQNLTFLPENAIVIIGAGGNVTSDVANLTYYAANQTLVVKFLKGDGTGITGISVGNASVFYDTDNSAYYIDPANTVTSAVLAGNLTTEKTIWITGGGTGGSTGTAVPSNIPGMFFAYDTTTGRGSITTINKDVVWKSLDLFAQYVNTSSSILVGGVSAASSGGIPIIAMKQISPDTHPSGMGADTVAIYGKDVSGTTELFTIDEGGTYTQQTSHPSDFLNTLPNDANHTFPWVYTASNPYLGKKITVDSEAAFRALEFLTGNQFVYTENINKLSWSELEDWRESTENNKSRDAAVQAWLRNASELEVSPSLAFEWVWDNKTVETGHIINYTTEYSFDENGTVMASLIPVFETKTISKKKKQLKEGIQFNKAIGEFYRKPTKAEAELAVGGNYSHYVRQDPPKWMKDRGAGAE